MKRRFVIALVGLSLMSARTQAAADVAPGDSRSARVDALFARWNAPGSPGCVVGVMSQGKLVYAKGYGLADIARGIALSPDTVFDVASMSKQFTAASLGALVLDDKLALGEDIRARFPELRLDVPVTIDNLVHHTSGLRDYAEVNMLRGTEAIDNKGVLAMLARQSKLNFLPGSQFAYSNSNYVLLAELIQRVGGKSLADLAHDRLFAPLKMQSTGYAGAASADPANLANSYMPAAAGAFISVPRALQTVGDGNLLTTVNDLARWDASFYSVRADDRARVALMRTTVTATSGEPTRYGFGLMFGEYRGMPTEAHGGSYHGFRTELLRFPHQHFSASVLCNVATANASSLAHQVADIYLGDTLQPKPATAQSPAEVKIEPTAFDAYAGAYLIETQGQRNVLFFGRQGSRFFSQPFGDMAIELFPASGTEFFAKVDDVRIVFGRGEDGAVSTVTLHRPTTELVGRRIVARLSNELMSELAGVYHSTDLDAQWRLELTGGQVIVDIGQNRRFPLIAISDSSFAMPGGATCELTRDTDGRIAGFEYSSPRVRGLSFTRKRD